jgi:prophage antirepressor-like protein
MNAISTFKIPSEIISGGIVTEIRTIMQDNEPWFFAKDVADVLGIKNVTQAIADLDEDELMYVKHRSTNSTDTRLKEFNIISESGFYRLVMRSRKPVAKPFQKWVTKDVLPSIRKTGSYSLGGDKNSPFPENEKLERNLLALKFAQENLAVSDEDRIRMARQLFDTFGLESKYLPEYVDGKPASSLSSLLREFGVKMGAVRVFMLLQQEGIVERKTRKSSKGEKEFWSIKDQKFGKKQAEHKRKFFSNTTIVL